MIPSSITDRYECMNAPQRFDSGVFPCVLGAALLVAMSFLGCGGGGGSTGGNGNPPPPSTTLVLNLAANQIVYDSNRQRLYASVGSTDANYPNTVAFIDPSTDTVTITVAVGANPHQLTLSQDGSYLYVGANGISSIQRINLSSNTIDETIVVGSDSFGNVYYAGDIEVMPGSPGTIGVVRLYPNTLPPHAVDVAIFDGTTMRPNTASPFGTSAYAIDSIAFSGSGSALYGVDNEASDFAFVRMSIDASGVSIQDFEILLGFGYNATMIYNSGLIYSSTGTILNPSALTLQGKFPLSPSLAETESVLIRGGIPYLLTHNPGVGPVITAYNPQTYLETATSAVKISGYSDSETSLDVCGNACFAFIEVTGTPNLTTSVVVSTAALTPVSTAPPTLNNVSPNHILWNAATGLLYASIPGAAGPWGNSIAVINPSTQAIESTTFVGSDPDVLALSADGAFLYVGLDGSASIAQFNLTTGAVDLTFFLGLDPILGGPTLPASISVSPSDSTTVAVARLNPAFQPEGEIVAIYEDGVMLPNTTETNGYDGSSVAFCSSASTLYGLDSLTSDGFYTLSVTGTGVQETNGASGLIGGLGGNIICDMNVIYASTGYAVDPLTDTQLGIFSGLQTPAAVAVDDANEQVFFLDNNSGNSVSIVGFDQTSYSQTGTLSVPMATSSGRDLVRWGTNGFAVATQSQVVLLTGTLP